MMLDPRLENAINKTYDLIARVTAKQGFLLPFEDIYGDGTPCSPLSKAGVKIVYDAVEKELMPKKTKKGN